MGRAIVIGSVVVILGAFIVWVSIYFRRKKSQEMAKEKGWAVNGDLSLTEELSLLEKNERAAGIFRMLLAPPSTMDIIGDQSNGTLLGDVHRAQIESWLRSHDARITVTSKRRRKGIGR